MTKKKSYSVRSRSTAAAVRSWQFHRFLRALTHQQPIFLLLELCAAVVLIYITVQKVQEYQTLNSRAAAGTATVYLFPTTPTLTTTAPTTSIKLFATIDRPLDFARVELAFNPSLVKLSQEIALTDPKLTRVITKTAMADANAAGHVVIVLGLDPAYAAAPPTANVQLATLTFTKATTTSTSASIAFPSTGLQLVDNTAVPFSLTTQGATIALNPPPATPTPSSQPTPTATPSPTTPPTPPPGPADTTAPTISFTNPLNGTIIPKNSTVTIMAAVGDNVGVTKVDFYINNSIKCTDTTAPFSCLWKVPGKKGTSYTLKGVASDLAGNRGQGQVVVTVNP